MGEIFGVFLTRGGGITGLSFLNDKACFLGAHICSDIGQRESKTNVSNHRMCSRLDLSKENVGQKTTLNVLYPQGTSSRLLL